MRKKIFFAALICSVSWLSAGDVSMTRSYPENMLKNADFSMKDAGGMPRDWEFDNCSRAKFSFRSDIGGIVIESPGQAYGYFLQTVPVREGVTYHTGTKMRVYRTFANMWLRCVEYHDNKSALGHWPPSQTDFFIQAYPYHGKSTEALLKKFIDPKLVAGVDDKEWTEYCREFTTVTGKGVRNYQVLVGCFGGYRGWVNYTDVYFAPAASTLEITVNRDDWKELSVTDKSGRKYFEKVNDGKCGNHFSTILPSRLAEYFLHLTADDGMVHTMEVPNE